jgi:4a-hydroxytetrahydrobiopterin dehydratase
MAQRVKLSEAALAAFVSSHSGWQPTGGALAKTFAFRDYGSALGFVVRVALAAEKRDHHPDLLLTWGKVRVSWSTHDAGGVTALDTEMIEQTEQLAA